MKTASRRVVVHDGVRTTYLEAGDGQVLLLLHGGALGECAETAWDRLVDPLAASFRVLAPDWPGFGGSAKVRDTADLPGGLLRHLAGFLRALGVDSAQQPVSAVGQSMGGSMLLRDAASPRPLLPLRRRVLVSAGGSPLDPELWRRLMDFDGSTASMRRQVELCFADPRWANDEGYLERRVAAATVPGTWELLASVPLRPPWAPAPPPGDPVPYERVTGPTLLVVGGQDRLKPAGWHEEVVRRLPDGRAHVVAGAGHNPHVEAADEVADVVLSFLHETDPDSHPDPDPAEARP